MTDTVDIANKCNNNFMNEYRSSSKNGFSFDDIFSKLLKQKLNQICDHQAINYVNTSTAIKKHWDTGMFPDKLKIASYSTIKERRSIII